MTNTLASLSRILTFPNEIFRTRKPRSKARKVKHGMKRPHPSLQTSRPPVLFDGNQDQPSLGSITAHSRSFQALSCIRIQLLITKCPFSLSHGSFITTLLQQQKKSKFITNFDILLWVYVIPWLPLCRWETQTQQEGKNKIWSSWIHFGTKSNLSNLKLKGKIQENSLTKSFKELTDCRISY